MKALPYAAAFFVIAIFAAVFGMSVVAAGAAEVAKVLFFVFLIVAAVMLVLGLFGSSREVDSPK
jgi:uncharacterized membrane protein YtjA (UPF0391 family)